VDLPWPEKNDRPEAEAPGKRESPSDDRPRTERPTQRDKYETVHPLAEEPNRTRIWPIIIGIAVVLILAALLWWAIKPSEPKVSYSLAKAAIANVTVTAHAEGLLAARDPVEVVAPIGARLERAKAKSGDRVRQGQILALLNSENARNDMVDANAEFAAQQSAVARADADVAEARAELARARSSTTADAADTAEARLARAVARADEARAVLGADQTRLASARAKLNGLVVRAPFDAIVLKSNLDTTEPVRMVARGQSLFTLVRDLSALELTADFPESAVGRLRAGDQALFTVAAFPHRTFAATLNTVSAWPKVVHKEGDGDVTTYAGTLAPANSGQTLRPGMNADVAVILAQAKDVLTVPNAALMFRPPAKLEEKYSSAIGAQAAPLPRSRSASGTSAPGLGPPSAPAGSWSPVVLSPAPRPGRVWVLDGDTPKPRDIMVGMSDGNITQVISGELRAGDAVITNAIVQARGNANRS
jgi:HlyD family secretion protein